MFKFIAKLCCFLAFICLVTLAGIMLPATPRASTAHLFAKIDKDSLLKNSASPRIILIGGSNISMSINSKLLMDSLRLYPVNTGLSASIGLLYMLDSSLPYIRPGDVVIVSPEYSQFYNDLEIGTEDLVRVVLDNGPAGIFKLRGDQFLNCLKYIPRYALSKFKPMDYLSKPDTTEIYQRTSFNEYGDMDRHWRLAKKTFPPLEQSGTFDERVLYHLDEYRRRVQERGGRFYVTFPALDEESFQVQRAVINTVRSRLMAGGFEVLGHPVRYKMPMRYMFDTPYHLTQPGVDYRTLLLIEDLQAKLDKDVDTGLIYSARKRDD